MKKNYQRPQILKVSLKVDQTVLGGCKFQGYAGPGSSQSSNCGVIDEGDWIKCNLAGS